MSIFMYLLQRLSFPFKKLLFPVIFICGEYAVILQKMNKKTWQIRQAFEQKTHTANKMSIFIFNFMARDWVGCNC